MTDQPIRIPKPRPGEFRINRATGQWANGIDLNATESAIIAASVLPGWTPDLAADLYGAWLEADGATVIVRFADGDHTVTKLEGGDVFIAVTELAAAQQRLNDVVAAKRAAGVTWREIGEEYGVTRQAAQERFS